LRVPSQNTGEPFQRTTPGRLLFLSESPIPISFFNRKNEAIFHRPLLLRASDPILEQPDPLPDQNRILNDTELWIFGSQALLGEFPDAPESLRTSIEVDVQPKNRPEAIDAIDGAIDELSVFHQTQFVQTLLDI
jgi:hypothetical protein